MTAVDKFFNDSATIKDAMPVVMPIHDEEGNHGVCACTVVFPGDSPEYRLATHKDQYKRVKAALIIMGRVQAESRKTNGGILFQGD
jgi:hypothetical protein